MTNEQLKEYERLMNLVTNEEDNLFDSVGHLATMRVEEGESVEDYIVRLQEAIDEVNLEKTYLAEAKASVRVFITSI